jgi:hypothetical protein
MMYYTLCCFVTLLFTFQARASEAPYIGLGLGSRTIALANFTEGQTVSIIAQWPASKAYVSWFADAFDLKLLRKSVHPVAMPFINDANTRQSTGR